MEPGKFLQMHSPADYLRDARETLKAYVFGQSLVSTLLGLSTWGGLTLVGLPGAFWLGLMSGALSLIPVLGISLALVVTLIVALFQSPVLSAIAGVCGVFLAVQLLEGLVLSPLILGRSLGLNPILALLALVGFGLLLGPFGVLLGVPLAALFWKWGRRFHREINSPQHNRKE